MGIIFDYSHLLNNNDITLEAFYGTKSEFPKIEKELEKIIKMCHNIDSGAGYTDINNSTELYNVEKLFCKAFGLEDINITFYSAAFLMMAGNLYGPNAFTVPSFLTYFKKKTGNMASPEDMVCNVWVDVQLVTTLDLTPRELMAFILHELGHCFDASFIGFLGSIAIVNNPKLDLTGNILATIIGNISRAAAGSTIGDIYTFIDRQINGLIHANSAVASFITNLLKYVREFFAFMGNIGILKILQNPLALKIRISSILTPQYIFGYTKEKIADSFATSYGYGVELARCMHKLSLNEQNIIDEVVDDIPVLNIGYDLCRTSAALLGGMLDVHPLNSTRIINQLNKLKRDIKDPNLSPKVRKELESNINELEKYINNTVLDTNDMVSRGRIFSHLLNWVTIKVLKGKTDLRELFDVLKSHEF